MYALAAIHKFVDVDIHCYTGQHISILLRHLLFRHQVVNHLADSDLGCCRKVSVRTHGDNMCWGFCTRPGEMHVFADNKLQNALQRGLDRSNVDFAVTLGGMAVPNLKESSFNMDRDK